MTYDSSIIKSKFFNGLKKNKKLLNCIIRVIYIDYKNSRKPVYKSFSGLCTNVVALKSNSMLVLENVMKNIKITKKIIMFSNTVCKIYILQRLNCTKNKKIKHFATSIRLNSVNKNNIIKYLKTKSFSR